eukprot:3494587-Rhodomonas_salina.2
MRAGAGWTWAEGEEGAGAIISAGKQSMIGTSPAFVAAHPCFSAKKKKMKKKNKPECLGRYALQRTASVQEEGAASA